LTTIIDISKGGMAEEATDTQENQRGDDFGEVVRQLLNLMQLRRNSAPEEGSNSQSNSN
jgi:hypothetical protein